MRISVVAVALAALFLLAPVATGSAPAWSQDFSITNPSEPADAGRRELMRQLQAWWRVHAYYPRHASQNDESGTVKVHLVIHPDGNIWMLDVVDSSGSSSLDAAGLAAFRDGFVRPFPSGMPEASIGLSLHYVLAHRHDETVPAGYTQALSTRPFTITNDPIPSPILETMLQRTCTGTVVKEGIRNHPMYGGHYSARAIFFREPDGTSWVRFDEGGEPLIAPVTATGNVVRWTGRAEHPKKGIEFYYQYTVWPDGDNNLIGTLQAYFYFGSAQGMNTGGTVDFSCATERVPPIALNPWLVGVYHAPPVDPP